jgi:anti-sigma B factor antagonist
VPDLDGYGLSLTTEEAGPALIVHVAGDLDMLTGPHLDEYVRDKIAARTSQHLVLDLGRVTFLGSSALSVLIGLARNDLDVRLHLTAVSGNRAVQQTLDLVGMTPLFDIHDDVADLLRHLQG